MTATTTIDKAGRLVLPRKIREKFHLTGNSRLKVEVIGDKIQLSEAEAETKIERRGKRRVIVGWKGYSAEKAVTEAREGRTESLEAPFGK